MTRPLTRFEKILVSGMIVTGLGIVACYLVEMDGATSPPQLAPPEKNTGRQPIRVWKNEFPDGDGWWKFFAWYEIDGRTKNGETVRGHVEGIEQNGNGVKVLDERTGLIRYYSRDELDTWEVREYPHPYPQDYVFRVRRPGGKEDCLLGKLIREREDSFVIHLEQGMVVIARGDMVSVRLAQLANR
ncbi:MAG: hypothetical protein HY720_19655 [Planctomycetes bacterium]|nr:hypothetical protein [Planctomycetota bacterium]